MKKCYYRPEDRKDSDSESSGASGNRVTCRRFDEEVDEEVQLMV